MTEMPARTAAAHNAAERVVVVGFGPVAARLLEELEPALDAGLLHVTVIGEEPAAAYNRVLVADVAVGRTTAEAISLADPQELRARGVDVRLGVRVRRVDRARRLLRLDDGGTLEYDRLVLATGSRPVVPNLLGLNADPSAAQSLPAGGSLFPAGVTALRDLRDAAVLRSAVAQRRRVVVLGGGILGLETALAAADEGTAVTVVHHGPHPLGRSIDAPGGAVLAAALRRSGIRLASNARSTAVELAGPDGGFTALLLEDGSAVDGDLLVLSCGVRPRTELARGAGLATAAGILVDHRLQAHHDERVYAIGDCAEIRCLDARCLACRHSSGPHGLIGPGWRQAEWLAGQLAELAAGPVPAAKAVLPGNFVLAGNAALAANSMLAGSAVRKPPEPMPVREPLPAEEPPVILLKARGIDLAAAGNAGADPWDEELLQAGSAPGRPRLQVALWADPEHGRYVKMCTRDGVLEGLVCIGMPRTAAELVLLFERGAELPADRSGLLRLDGPERLLASSGPSAGAAGVAADPEHMVCRCAGVSRDRIQTAVGEGCGTVAEVSGSTRAGTGCGGCHDSIRELIERHFQPVAG